MTLATVLRTNKFFKKIVDSPSGTLKTGVHPRTFNNRNRLVAQATRSSTASRPATPAARATCSSARASRNGIQLVSAVLGTPSEAARDSDTMALYRWAFPRFQRIRAVIEGRPMATAQIRYRAGAELKLVPARTVRRIVQRGHRDGGEGRRRTPRPSSRGRSAAASGSGASRSARAARSSRRSR